MLGDKLMNFIADELLFTVFDVVCFIYLFGFAFIIHYFFKFNL